jgi:hypothetical protein
MYVIFGLCYNEINNLVGTNLQLNPNIWHYVPEINYARYDVSAADQFLAQHEKVYLFCNGQVRSMQSSINDMQGLIELFAAKHPQVTFLATEKFNTATPNIKFTADIFGLENDLCEISYLSTSPKVNLIVGKNSGPFTFANTRRNLLDHRKIFVNFSHHACDTLPFGLDISADFRHTNTIYNQYIYETIAQAIHDEMHNHQTSGFKHV